MITERDQKVFEFISEFNVATTSTLYNLFYPTSLRVCRRRLKFLTDYGYIKRERSHIDTEYMYYINKPKQLRHNLLRTNFYRELAKIKDIKIEYFISEFDKFEGLRPDGFIIIQYGNAYLLLFLEVEISSKGLDLKKYRHLYLSERYKQYFNTFPIILVISNKRIKNNEYFKVMQVKEDMSNVENIINSLTH